VHTPDAQQATLFANLAPSFAPGFAYEPDFLSIAEESALLGELAQLAFEKAKYKEYRARRRIVSYGGHYDFDAHRLSEGRPLAPFLLPLRERVAAWVGCPASALTHALISEYSPGTPLGWHRDVPEFELIAGLSLKGAGRLRFRRFPPRFRERAVAVELAPRSVYVLRDEARWNWQHSVPPVSELRYSITLRTLRASQAA
jgi:alkylated DNA repair dioxygenase AlkB